MKLFKQNKRMENVFACTFYESRTSGLFFTKSVDASEVSAFLHRPKL